MSDQRRPRIPPLTRDQYDEGTEELLRSLRADPDGDDLNIFATLARHPKLLKRWVAFGATVLYGALPRRDCELLILRTGRNCGSDYEWHQHVRIGLASGVTREEIERLETGDDDAWPEDDRWLLRAADELHRDSSIGDETWAALAARYDEQQLIELCMVVGQYHLVAFTLNSLGIEIEDDDRLGIAGG